MYGIRPQFPANSSPLTAFMPTSVRIPYDPQRLSLYIIHALIVIIMAELEVLLPVCIGPIDEATAKAVGEYARVEKTVTGFTNRNGGSPKELNETIHTAFDQFPVRIEDLYALPPQRQVGLYSFLLKREIAEPSAVFNPIARPWHDDGEFNYHYDVIATTDIPPEVLSGTMDLSKLPEQLEEKSDVGVIRYADLSSKDRKAVGDWLTTLPDDELATHGLYISQMRPYHGYILDAGVLHRSPVNHLGVAVNRVLINLTFMESNKL